MLEETVKIVQCRNTRQTNGSKKRTVTKSKGPFGFKSVTETFKVRKLTVASKSSSSLFLLAIEAA